MLTEEVSKLNIGRSQLDLTYLSKGHVYNVNRMELIKNMATQLFMPGCDSHLPDFYLNGNWNGKDGFQINLDFKGFNFHYHNLYITGVPTGHFYINDFKLRDCLWSSFCEDEYGGYLFQILGMNKFLITLNNHENDEGHE